MAFFSFQFVLAILFLATAAYADSKGGKNCTLSLKKDLKSGHPAILDPNLAKFLYPNATKIKIPSGQVGLRVACPGASIAIKGTLTNRTEAALNCSAKGKFQFSADNSAKPMVFQVKDLKCSATINSSSMLLAASNNATRLRRVSIGLQLSPQGANATIGQFVASIAEIAEGVVRGQPIKWARAHLLASIAQREPSKLNLTYRQGSLDAFDMDEVYARENQRTSLLEVLNDTALVDKYLPTDGDNYWLQGQLISRDDLYFEAEQSAAFVYDNVVPIWGGVAANWKLVGDVVRSHATQSTDGLDVWSGSFGQLYLDDPTKPAFVELTHGVLPPQFLFKYVHEASSNKGLVFVTVNNPHLAKISARHIICDKYSSCDLHYPEFMNSSRGYTYCCRLDDFRFHANLFELPSFPGAEPLL